MMLCAIGVAALAGWRLTQSELAVADDCFGPFFASPESWFAALPAWASVAANFAVIIASAALLNLLNKTFNFIRAVTSVHASVFLILEMSSPKLFTTFCTGNLLCLMALCSVYVLFAAYREPRSERSILAVMFFAMAAALTQHAFLLLIPLFIIGFAQMQALNFRTLLAAVMGILAPLLIIFGLCIVSPFDVQWPHFLAPLADPTSTQSATLIATVSAIGITTLIITCANLLRIINYRLQTRLLNAFFVFGAILAIAMIAIDLTNAWAYMPMLNACLAVEVGQLYIAFAEQKRRYLLVLLIIVLSAGCLLPNLV